MAINKDFLNYISALLGPATNQFLQAMEQSPVVAVRLNPRRQMAQSPIQGEPVAWCPEGLYLPSRPLFTLMPEMHGGALYPQDASSMIYYHIFSFLAANVQPRDEVFSVLDLCAAPGGKSSAIIDAMPDDTVVVSNEFVGKRAAVLAENMAKWGHPHSIVTNSATDAFAAMQCFDLVAVDAPCSGEGMMRKEPEAVAQWTPSLVKECARLQRDIIADAFGALRPGGVMVYSTCTFNSEEDEGNVTFAIEQLGMEPVEIPVDKAWGISPALTGSYPCMRFMPHSTRGEGLFVAVLRKPDDEQSLKRRPQGNSSLTSFKPIKENPELSRWLDRSQRWAWRERNSVIHALSPGVETMLEHLPKGIRILSAGISVATIKGKDFIPAHELALSLALNPEAFPRAELQQEDALKYLRRESIVLPPDFGKGFVIVSFNGIRLGFVKNIVSRANNLYPQQWRIRIQ